MNYNFHTHTPRCGHATGTEEEYINIAIENGIKHMGFSDHMPLVFPDGTESSFRVPFSEGKIYCDHIKELARKYKADIDIHVGFETEYYPDYFDEMLSNARHFGAEYLILGQHYFKPENTCQYNTRVKTDSIDDLEKFVSSVVSAIKTKVFSFVAHPDIFNFSGDVDIYQKEMRKICIAATEENVPLEINFNGIRYGAKYPNDHFWQLAGEERSPVTFGFDAHDLVGAYNADFILKAEEIVKKHNLNYIGAPKLISIQK